jgi:tellurite resistance protein TerC
MMLLPSSLGNHSGGWHNQKVISTSTWIWSIGAIVAILLVDFANAYRNRERTTSVRAAVISTAIFIALAIAFGLALGRIANPQISHEFFAGWMTEYSLSFDNLFVFILILAKFKVSKERAELALFFGIGASLILRGGFIALGSFLIARFTWTFFIFGAFLIYTALTLLKEEEDEEYEAGFLITSLTKRGWSMFALALAALAVTDVLFAFDSIPAIFGLTKSAFVVITANAFALMGLRQLYFVIGGLMSKLIYLSQGLAVLLAFIGIKLILEAAASVGIKEIMGAKLPQISLNFSLIFILATLALTALVSALASRENREI